MTLAKYVIKTVEKNGPMTARAVIKAYRRTKAGKKSKSSDAVLETKARKTLKASASIAKTAAGTAVGMELYRFIHPPREENTEGLGEENTEGELEENEEEEDWTTPAPGCMFS